MQDQQTKIVSCLPWSIAGAVPACYSCSTADAGDVIWVQVEAGEF
jgi:hypothetical protein